MDSTVWHNNRQLYPYRYHAFKKSWLSSRQAAADYADERHMPPLCLAEALAQWLSHFYSSILYFIELHNCFMERVTANKRDKDNQFFVWFSCTSMKKNSFYQAAYMVGTQTLPHCINCSATFLASLSSLTATAKHTNFHKQDKGSPQLDLIKLVTFSTHSCKSLQSHSHGQTHSFPQLWLTVYKAKITRPRCFFDSKERKCTLLDW